MIKYSNMTWLGCFVMSVSFLRNSMYQLFSECLVLCKILNKQLSYVGTEVRKSALLSGIILLELHRGL